MATPAAVQMALRQYGSMHLSLTGICIARPHVNGCLVKPMRTCNITAGGGANLLQVTPGRQPQC